MSNDLPTFGEYQQFIRDTGFYPGLRARLDEPNTQGLTYTALGLTGEAGEVADKIKKILRDQSGIITDEARRGLLLEAGDVLWYLTALCNELDVELDFVARMNVEKIEGRTARGTRKGSGDDR